METNEFAENISGERIGEETLRIDLLRVMFEKEEKRREDHRIQSILSPPLCRASV
jgi:hypothetical protein